MKRCVLRKLQGERLESRKMMAGNVTAHISEAGDLIIRGDELNNNFWVLRGRTDDEVYIRQDAQAGTETLINGQQEATLTGFTGSINIKTRDGADHVYVMSYQEPWQIKGGVSLNTGPGSDLLGLVNLDVAGTTSIRTTRGNDVLYVKPGTFRGDLNVSTEGGKDFVELHSYTNYDQFDTGFEGKVHIKTGFNHDRILVNGPYFSSDVVLVTGGGSDVVEVNDAWFHADLDVETEDGKDFVRMFVTKSNRSQAERGFAGDVAIDTGRQSDYLTIGHADFPVDFWSHFQLETGRGHDDVDIQLSHFAAEAILRTDRGDDQVKILQSVFEGDMQLETEGHADLIEIVASEFHGHTKIDGGPSWDRLDFFENETNFKPQIRSFVSIRKEA